MLSFLLIIVTTISIIGYSEIGYARNQAYTQNYQRMESYANSLGNLAEADIQNGTALLSNNFLNQLEYILRGDDAHLRIFNDKNEQIYPKTKARIQLSQEVFTTLKMGKRLEFKIIIMKIHRLVQLRMPTRGFGSMDEWQKSCWHCLDRIESKAC